MERREWSELTRGERAVVLALGSVQLSLAVSAWADLAARPPEEVRGRKSVWAAVIAVNIVGPTTYFLRGRRTR